MLLTCGDTHARTGLHCASADDSLMMVIDGGSGGLCRARDGADPACPWSAGHFLAVEPAPARAGVRARLANPRRACAVLRENSTYICEPHSSMAHAPGVSKLVKWRGASDQGRLPLHFEGVRPRNPSLPRLTRILFKWRTVDTKRHAEPTERYRGQGHAIRDAAILADTCAWWYP